MEFPDALVIEEYNVSCCCCEMISDIMSHHGQPVTYKEDSIITIAFSETGDEIHVDGIPKVFWDFEEVEFMEEIVFCSFRL